MSFYFFATIYITSHEGWAFKASNTGKSLSVLDSNDSDAPILSGTSLSTPGKSSESNTKPDYGTSENDSSIQNELNKDTLNGFNEQANLSKFLPLKLYQDVMNGIDLYYPSNLYLEEAFTDDKTFLNPLVTFYSSESLAGNTNKFANIEIFVDDLSDPSRTKNINTYFDEVLESYRNDQENYIHFTIDNSGKDEEFAGYNGYWFTASYRDFISGQVKIKEINTIIGDKAYVLRLSGDPLTYDKYLPVFDIMTHSITITKNNNI